MTTNREMALSALQTAWNHAGEDLEGKVNVRDFALTFTFAGIGFALLDIASAIRGDTEPLSVDDFEGIRRFPASNGPEGQK